MSHIQVRWDYFQNNVSTGFSYLQQREEFVDMTLAADGHTVKVHKNVLALASPYIKEMLQTMPCPHPVLFLNNVTSQFLHYILEYIYTGEVVIPPDNAEEFFKVCKSLHIVGICEIPPLPKKPLIATETDFMNNPSPTLSDPEYSKTEDGIQIEHKNSCEVMNNDITNVDQHVEPVKQPVLGSYLTTDIQQSEIGTCSKTDENTQDVTIDVVPAIENHTITNAQESEIDTNSGNNYPDNEYDNSNLIALDTSLTLCHPTTNLLEVKMGTCGRNDEFQYVNNNIQPIVDINPAIDSQEAEMDTYDENYECQNVNIVQLQPDLDIHPAIDSQETDLNIYSGNDECQYSNSNIQVLDIQLAIDSQEAEMDTYDGNEHQYLENNTQADFEGPLITNIQENEMCTGNEYDNEYEGESNLNTKENSIDNNNSNVDQLSHNYAIDVQIVNGDDEPPKFILRQLEEPHASTLNADHNVFNPFDLRCGPLYSLTIRGCLQIIVNRYMYNMHFSSYGNRRKRWRCIDYRSLHCKAHVDTIEDSITSRKFDHQHPFHDDKIIARGHENNIFATRAEAIAALKMRNAQSKDETTD